MSKALFVVFNVRAGHGDAGEVRASIEAACQEAGRTVHIMTVDDPRKLPDIAHDAVRRAQGEQGIVVVAGGDGTINAVAQAVLGSGCPFGVLPQGTFNYFSRTHGIPADTAQAMHVVLNAVAQPVQVGEVNGRIFLVNASLGLYPRLLEDRETLKQQWGRSRLVALISGVWTLLRGHRSLRLRIEAEGGHPGRTDSSAGASEPVRPPGNHVRDVKTPTLFIGNNALQLEQLGLPHAPAVDAGELAAAMMKPVGRLAMAVLIMRGALGRLGEAREVSSFSFKRLVVRRRRGFKMPFSRTLMKVAVDGEIVWLPLPLQFQVAPQSLMLLRPVAPAAEREST